MTQPAQSRDERGPAPAVMRTPRTVDLEITSRCNLRCRYCYYFSNPAVEYRDLAAAEWLAFFEELGSLAVMDVCIAGGEPFFREDLVEILEGVVRNRMRFTILSNGALIDDRIAAFLAGTRRCDHVQISLDGSSPETHDAGRGRGSFEGAVRGIRTLQRNGVPVGVRLTIHRHNVHDLEATARFIFEDLGLPAFGTNSAGFIGACRTNADDVMLRPEDRRVAMEALLRLTRKYGNRINAAAGPLAEARMWGRMEEARAGGKAAFPNGGRLTGCGCPSKKIAVRADGVIVPCTMLAQMELGRIGRDSLLEVWRKSEPLNRLRRRHEIPLATFGFCAGCSYQPYCTGNCPGVGFNLTGEVDHPSPDACLRGYLREGGELPRPEGAEGGA